ncbi:YIP1 family protein [Candidatus Pacearchaeota archaeon]|nr:YIP1 family protein [Candidatus Pacearchaeota archaeon]
MSFKKYLEKYKKLAAKPREFFRSIYSEDVIPAIKFYLFMIIAFSIMIIILSFITVKFDPARVIIGIVQLITNIIISFLTVIIFSALVYAGTLIYNKGKAEFGSIFKVLLYSLTIMLFYSALGVIIASGFEIYHPMSSLLSQINQANPNIIIQEVISDKIHVTRIAIILLILFISIIHFLTLATIGLSESHKLKRWRAFLSIITIPIILIILMIIALVLAVSGV